MAAPSFAQTYPAKPIRVIVGVPPGGTSDTSARIIAPKLAEALGQQILVENRPGANNGIATEYVARSQPDGYTLLWAFSGALVINPGLYPDVRYDPLKDLVPIQLVGTFQFILVVPRSVPASSVKELIALAKAAKPGEYTYASGGIGSPNHLTGELLKRSTGVELAHVPYKGGGPAVISVLAAETKMYFAGIGSVREHMRTGALKPLAVTGPKRAPEAPAVPTMQEAGIPGYDVQAWIGVLSAAGTPAPIVTRVHQALAKVQALPEVAPLLTREGLDLADITPAAFGARIKTELAMWTRLIKEAGIKAE
ncbi:MAG: tripartite tricarboxylate transporter substrate binding protein [Burkholderiales bacterium]|nr:tripartite tricarboxylate transporter substrate binding protein [Burkholderiales bacterium]